jgi:hypothetical protein
MTTKKKIRREPSLFQLFVDLFGKNETQAVEAEPMTNRKFYFFFVIATIVMFTLSFLIKVFIT